MPHVNPFESLLNAPTPTEAANADAEALLAAGQPFDPTSLRDQYGQDIAATVLTALMDADRCHIHDNMMVPGPKPVPKPSLTAAQRRALFYLASATNGKHLVTSPDSVQQELIEAGVAALDGDTLHYVRPFDSTRDKDTLTAIRTATSAILRHLNSVGATDLTELTDIDAALRGEVTERLDGILVHCHKGRWGLIERRRPSTDAERAEQVANRRAMLSAKPKSPAVPTLDVPPSTVSVGVSRDEAITWMNATYGALVTLNDAVRCTGTPAHRTGPTVEDVLRRCMVGIVADGVPATRTALAKRRITRTHRSLVPTALDYGVVVGALHIHGARTHGYGVRYIVGDPGAVGMSWEELHEAAAKLKPAVA